MDLLGAYQFLPMCQQTDIEQIHDLLQEGYFSFEFDFLTLRHSTFWEILWGWGCRWFHGMLPCNYCSFRDHPSRISITKPCGFSGERGRKGGGVRDCLLHRVQMPGYYFLIEPPGVPAYPGIFHLSLDCLRPPPTCHGAAARQKPKLALGSLGTKDRVDWIPTIAQDLR